MLSEIPKCGSGPGPSITSQDHLAWQVLSDRGGRGSHLQQVFLHRTPTMRYLPCESSSGPKRVCPFGRCQSINRPRHRPVPTSAAELKSYFFSITPSSPRHTAKLFLGHLSALFDGVSTWPSPTRQDVTPFPKDGRIRGQAERSGNRFKAGKCRVVGCATTPRAFASG